MDEFVVGRLLASRHHEVRVRGRPRKSPCRHALGREPRSQSLFLLARGGEAGVCAVSCQKLKSVAAFAQSKMEVLADGLSPAICKRATGGPAKHTDQGCQLRRRVDV